MQFKEFTLKIKEIDGTWFIVSPEYVGLCVATKDLNHSLEEAATQLKILDDLNVYDTGKF